MITKADVNKALADWWINEILLRSWQTWWSTTNDVPQQNPPIVAKEFSMETDIMSTSFIWWAENRTQKNFKYFFEKSKIQVWVKKSLEL